MLHKLNKNIKNIALFLMFIFSFLAINQVAMAQGVQNNSDKYGLKETAEEGYGAAIEDIDKPLSAYVGQIIGALLAFVGLIFLILIIYGGFMWMTAAGNEEKVHTAINLIVQSVIGLLIISSAYLITQFVGETVTLPFTG